MGHGSYTATDWAKLKTSRKLETSSTNQIFQKSSLDPRFDPKYIGKRESRDSENHPRSTPIMIGVDVTGSMGYLSTQIIKESLNELMQKLYSSELVQDPQLLFAAVGDARSDHAPLQVTQFESDIRIAEQLMDLWLENRGGDFPEDYELLWYFAANHTDTDAYKKRGEKGFCFTIGDAACHEQLTSNAIRKIFDDSSPDVTSQELARQAGKYFELFHIVIGNSSHNFSSIIPGRVVKVSRSDIHYLPEIIISVIQLSKGVPKQKVLQQWGELASVVVKNAIAHLNIEKKDGFRF